MGVAGCDRSACRGHQCTLVQTTSCRHFRVEVHHDVGCVCFAFLFFSFSFLSFSFASLFHSGVSSLGRPRRASRKKNNLLSVSSFRFGLQFGTVCKPNRNHPRQTDIKFTPNQTEAGLYATSFVLFGSSLQRSLSAPDRSGSEKGLVL